LRICSLQIVAHLGLGKPGPLVGKLTVAAKEWQYVHATMYRPPVETKGLSDPPEELLSFLRRKLNNLQPDPGENGVDYKDAKRKRVKQQRIA
jgi:hypothetical protein